jgi:hypothetical protein
LRRYLQHENDGRAPLTCIASEAHKEAIVKKHRSDSEGLFAKRSGDQDGGQSLSRIALREFINMSSSSDAKISRSKSKKAVKAEGTLSYLGSLSPLYRPLLPLSNCHCILFIILYAFSHYFVKCEALSTAVLFSVFDSCPRFYVDLLTSYFSIMIY